MGDFGHKLTHFLSLEIVEILCIVWSHWQKNLASSHRVMFTEFYWSFNLSLTKIVMILTWDLCEIFNVESSATFIYSVLCAELHGVQTLNQQVHQATFAECLLKWRRSAVIFWHPWNYTVRTNCSFFLRLPSCTS